MEKLNLPRANVSVKTSAGKTLIFDRVRKKWVALTPEEWVRQHMIHFLIEQKTYPEGLIQVEKEMVWNRMRLRTDILVSGTDGSPLVIVECKAPDIKLTNKVFEQIATYNQQYNVPFLIVTNGKVHYCCKLDYFTKSYVFLKQIPGYDELSI